MTEKKDNKIKPTTYSGESNEHEDSDKIIQEFKQIGKDKK